MKRWVVDGNGQMTNMKATTVERWWVGLLYYELKILLFVWKCVCELVWNGYSEFEWVFLQIFFRLHSQNVFFYYYFSVSNVVNILNSIRPTSYSQTHYLSVIWYFLLFVIRSFLYSLSCFLSFTPIHLCLANEYIDIVFYNTLFISFFLLLLVLV